MRYRVFDRCMGVAIAVLLTLYVAQAVELALFRQEVAEARAVTQQVVERRTELLDTARLACRRQ